MLQMQMNADSRIPPIVSQAVMQSFNAAANPNAETPEVVIKSLDPDERTNVQTAMTGYSQILGNVGSRGKMRLMLDSELDSMIQDEADE
jgi:hypothetical protein